MRLLDGCWLPVAALLTNLIYPSVQEKADRMDYPTTYGGLL